MPVDNLHNNTSGVASIMHVKVFWAIQEIGCELLGFKCLNRSVRFCLLGGEELRVKMIQKVLQGE